MTRLSDALRIRDEVLKVMSARGQWKNIDTIRALAADTGEFSFLYMTPFQARPDEGDIGYYRALFGKSAPMGYQLDVWFGRRKVLSLEWDSDGRAHIISFRRGAWETVIGSLNRARVD